MQLTEILVAVTQCDKSPSEWATIVVAVNASVETLCVSIRAVTYREGVVTPSVLH